MQKPILIYTNWLPFGLRGFCIPPFVGIHMDYADAGWVKRHELAHWVQYRRRGFLRYFFGYLVRWILYGYDRHPWEIEARRRGWEPRGERKVRK